MAKRQFILVEPISKTPFPPIGLMKISSWLKSTQKNIQIFQQIGTDVPTEVNNPERIFITSLFTWDMDKVINTTHYLQDRFPRAEIQVGGIAATLMPDYIEKSTGIRPHIGLLREAESYPPDYKLSFGRKLRASITYTSRGCKRNCKFCSVRIHEPEFEMRDNWERDIDTKLPRIVFWDNNWLESPYFFKDIVTIKKLNKIVDFNQGLDARLYDEEKAKLLSTISMDPIRFAFDDIKYERAIVNAIRLEKKYTNREICVYVLYNFEDSPEDLYYRIELLNREKALAFPMEYRKATAEARRFPRGGWDKAQLRAFKLSLLFYYRKGMITESRNSFQSIYGKTANQFREKLYEIYEYDKSLKRKRQSGDK